MNQRRNNEFKCLITVNHREVQFQWSIPRHIVLGHNVG